MNKEDQIVNRVANSALVTIDLESYYTEGERVLVDIKDQLYQGLVLKEKDFRDFIKTHSWIDYTGKHVAVTCSADAVIPTWAFMLLSIALAPYARTVLMGTLEDLEVQLFRNALRDVDWQKFKDAKVVVKGCSTRYVPAAVYVEVSGKLSHVAGSIMFGEPCSTVPLFKRPKT